MGLLSKLVSKGAKTIVPKILIGGTAADKAVVQKVVSAGVPEVDAIFDKFGKSAETGVKIAAAIAGTALTAGLLAPAAGTAGVGSAVAGGAAPLLKSVTNKKSVGLIDTITKGINKVDTFSKTDLGSSLIGTLGKVVTNLATPSQGKPSTVPQQLALQQGTASNLSETISQAAVFQGKGVSVKLGSDANGDTWWNRNKSWAMPAIFAVPGFFILLFTLFGRRRR